MKKFLLFISVLILSNQCGYCVTETLSPELQSSLKIHSNEPSFMTIAFALMFVIFLIYITGMIYSKLSIVGAKTVKKQLENQNLSNVMVLSTTQLGQNRNLHIVEANGRKLLVGATQNSINLIKDLDEKIVEEITIEPKEGVIIEEEFNLHKKYL